jgi:hypothetical protein
MTNQQEYNKNTRIHSSHTTEVKTTLEMKAPVKTLKSNWTNIDSGNILIQGCWEHGTDCIMDVDEKLNRALEPLEKFLPNMRMRRKRNALSPASSNVGTLPPLLSPQMASLARKPKRYSSVSQLSSQRNGRNLTPRCCMAMSMLKSALPLFKPPTSVCGDLVFQQVT